MADPRERTIAVVGIGCRLPGGVGDPGAARRLFLEGRDVVSSVPPDRYALPAVTRSGKPVPSAGAFLDGVDAFDAALFGISAREAAAMDPQQRLLLQCAWAALEDAGIRPDRLDGSRTGTWIGLGLVDWARRTVWSGDPDRLDAWAGTGTFDAVAAGRLAYVLGLRGPAMALHTACSASHVALHEAIRSLRAGEVDLALAGGVQLDLAPEPTVLFAELGALSPTGRCRTFDAGADGYVRGEGAGIFALLRERDAVDRGLRIHARLEGSAVNHDGRTNGLTAPSPRAQAEVLRAALEDARRRPGEVGLLEAHGTGTPLGDPIEVEALAAVYGSGDAPLHVSSGKTIVGHLEAAAGVAGLLRAIAALSGRTLPPHLHLRTPNPRLPLAGTRLVLAASGPHDARVAGVSGFGLSGTNAHLVVTAAPAAAPRPAVWPVLVALSANDEDALRDRVEQVRADPSRWAAGATSGRAALRHRAFRVLRDAGDVAGPWPSRRAGRPPGLVWVAPTDPEPGLVAWAERYAPVAAAVREVEAAEGPADAWGAETARRAWALAQWRLLAACGVRPDAVIGGDDVAPGLPRLSDVAAAAAEGLEVAIGPAVADGLRALPLAGDPDGALAAFGALFVAGCDVAFEPLVPGDRAEVPVYPFRAARHWLDPVGAAPPVRADFAIRRVPARPGSALAARATPFLLGAAACRRWSEPEGPLAVVDPACPAALAERALASVSADETWIGADGTATTAVVDPDGDAPRAPPLAGRVLVIGGTGHLGRAIVAALAARGARDLEVWSRRPPTAPWPPGVAVTHRVVDLTGDLPAIGGFSGAVHAAGDAGGDEATARAVRERTVAALDAALRDPGQWLVVVGSIAAHWGSPGLETYAGAHRAAEALVAARVAAGHAGAVVLAGPVEGGGLVSDDERAAFARAGVSAVEAARVAEVVAAAAGWRGDPLGVGRIDWSRLVPLAERTGRRAVFDRVRPAPVSAAPVAADALSAVLSATAKLLGRAEADPDGGFFAQGLDSVLAVQLARDLSAALGRTLPDTVIFDHGTPRALAAWLSAPAVPAGAPPAGRGPAGLPEPVAVVGLALRVPGADSPEALWALLSSDRDPLGPVPPDRWDAADWPEAPREGGWVDAAAFDGARFGVGPAEAAVLDPQQRLLLTCAWEALERAGIRPDGLVGARGSVHVGIGRSEYWDRVRRPDADGYVFSGTGNESSFAPGRVAHLLGLRGEAVAVNTACSASLVALHLACRALRAGDVDLALAAGVNVLAAPEAGTVLRRMGALSPTHRCRTFDAAADGYVRSEGAVVLVLMRLSEARAAGRPVWGVIEGSAVGHDGRSPGLGVPSGAAQEEVLRRALDDAGLSAGDLDGIGVHGTGTPLGDPIEVGALARVHAGRERPLVLSASKSRLGHLETAAGLAAVATVLLAMRHGAWFGNAHLRSRNPRLPAGPWVLPDRPVPWPADRPRRAGVSSFGLSGTGAHLVLREGDPFPALPDDPLLLGAGPSAAHAVAALVPAPVGFHARAHEAVRAVGWRGEPPPEPVTAKRGLRLGFVFPGQGAQLPAMGRALREAGLGGALDALLAPHPALRQVLDAEDDAVHHTRFTQPALVAVELVLGGWLRERGARPVAFVGHSVGELAAAALAGHLDPAEALAFAVARGRLVGDLPPGGGMVALRAPAGAVEGWLAPGTSIAAVNADDETTVAGSDEGLAAVVARAGAAGVEARPLRTSHAFHGPPMDAVREAVDAVGPAWRSAPGSGFVSALAGADPTAPGHWGRHLREPVAFAAALRAAPPVDVWVEVGPRATAAGLVARVLGADAVPLWRTGAPAELRRAAALLWARGAELDVPAERPGPTPCPPAPALPGRAWVALPRATAEPLPCSRIAWVPATPGATPPVVHVREARAVEDVLALARSLPEGAVVVRADGALGGTAPERAAIGGAFAALAAEHPDRDLRLFDGVPDDGLDAALRAGASRVRWDGGPRVPVVEPAPPGPGLVVADTWLVSGGDGALGSALVAWLRARGAVAEVLSRSAGTDVTDAAAVRAAVARVEGRGERVGGVVHAAGVARGALARDETADGLRAAWAPKVDGARHLLAEVGPEVPFVAVSSAIAWLGMEGQAAYAAANAGLEALVRGRPNAWALSLGPLSGGMADAVDWSGRGVRRAEPARAAATLGALPADPVVMPILWAPVAEGSAAPALRPTDALRVVLEVGRAVLGRELDPDVGFADAGADSLAAVELSRRLAKVSGRKLPATLVFEHPTPRALAAWLAGGDAPIAGPGGRHDAEPIAIVGWSCRFPGAPDPESLWRLLAAGGVAVGPVPPDRWDADAHFSPFPGGPGRAYVREGGFLPDPEAFDPEAFGLSPREATSLDPQQRLLLEVTREALEDAGHLDAALAGSRTAVYVGIADRGWLHAHHAPGAPLYPDGWAGTGNEPSFAAGRIAFTFGLRGEALALNTTCSSTLVAVHHAVRALRDGTADRALAGGVAMMFVPDDTAYLCALQALSPTHRCHVFDARADGYVRSEGCGVFVLTRLSDARARGDRVLAVIRGVATNHDGASSGLTVPNGVAQVQVLRAALADAGASPADVAFLEAHGTGTRLGDPIETRAVAEVYGAVPRPAPLLIGAVKANLGHTELAAGAASLAKVLLAARHGTIPGHPDLGEPNPELDLRGAELVGAARPWPAGARLVAISGFGLSGTNAHLILELPDAAAAEPPPAVGPAPLLVSAPTAGAARELAAAVSRLDDAPGDVAAALARRAPRRFRVAAVAADPAEARGLRSAPVAEVRGGAGVVLLASGQGSQVAGLGLGLDVFPAFRDALDACAGVLDPLLGRPLRALLADGSVVDRTEYTQPLLFATSWATAALLARCGVAPVAVAGHSLGELVAATVAGVWSLPDALRLVVERGRAMAEDARPGAMAAVALPAAEVAPRLVPGAELAAYNAPEEVVIAGVAEAVEATLAALPAGARVTRLPVSRPFHTACVEPMLARWEAAVAAVPARAASLPLVSLATGRLESDALARPAFWRAHARDPVRVTDAAAALAPLGAVFVDLGPTPVLSSLVRKNGVADPAAFVATQRRDGDAARVFAQALAELWLRGVDVDVTGLRPVTRRVALPPTPFERRVLTLPRPDRIEPAPAYAVLDDEVPATAPPPPRVRVVGDDVRGFAAALQGAGIEVAGDAPVTVDLRGHGAPLSPAGLLGLRDVGGERWIVVVSADDGPDASAWRAAALSARLERPATRVDVARVAGPADLVLALRADRDEIVVRGGLPCAPRLAPAAPVGAGGPVAGRWLVTGGTGALGMRFARWLAARGATGLVLASRTPVPDADPRRAALADLGCPVHLAAVDVTDEAAVAGLLAEHPVDGVIHAAGVTAPQPLDALDEATVAATLAGKVEGAAVLDRVLGDRPLLGFVLVGSIGAVWGSRDLSAYAAANGWLAGLARARRARGLAGQCLQFGPWGGGGMVDDERAAALARAGLVLLDPRGALHTVGAWLGAAADPVIVSADWDRLAPSLEIGGPQGLFRGLRAPAVLAPAAGRTTGPAEPLPDVILRHARAVLGYGPERVLAVDQSLADLGFDSLMATELKQRLLQDGVDLPLGRILSGPSVEEMCEMAGARAAPEVAAAPAAEAPEGDGPDRLWLWTHLAALIVGVALASGVWALLR